MRRTVLMLSQVFVPDPASVGQHMADVAAGLSARGIPVRVYTANRGYDDPSIRYPARQVSGNVIVRRLPLASFGKRSLWTRLAGQFLFLVQCVLRGVFIRRLAGVFVSTSPPQAALAALAIAKIRRVPIVYWVMDLNPDQAIALGYVQPGSLAARLADAANTAILRHAARVVALDRFMAERLRRKTSLGERLVVMPPWPHEDVLAPIPHQDNPFRAAHGLSDKTVIMYSGNHSPSHPLTTLVHAACRLRDRDDIAFLFIGGGAGKREIEDAIRANDLANVRTLDYQPLERLSYSLSAADVHVVSMGDDMVGCVHPCKMYGAMAVARPILLIGPADCHVGDLLAQADIGWRVGHGEVENTEAILREIAGEPSSTLAAMGERGRDLVARHFSKHQLCNRLVDVLETVFGVEGRQSRLSPTTSASPSDA